MKRLIATVLLALTLSVVSAQTASAGPWGGYGDRPSGASSKSIYLDRLCYYFPAACR